MKILLINTVCGVTSTGKICANLAQSYRNNGHQAVVAYGRTDLGMPAQFENISHRIGTDLDIKIHGVMTRLFDMHGFASWKATKEFLEWVDSYHPDIIHIHNLHGYYLNISLLFRYIKRHNISVVWTFHDCWPMTGHCSHFQAYGCEKWKSGCSHCKLKKNYPSSFLMDNSRRNYVKKKRIFNGVNKMVIVTPSKWLQSIVQQSYLNNYKVEIVNNGIDTNVFKPQSSNLREKYKLENKKILLGVANGWGPHKGLDYMKRLSYDLGNSWKVVLIGLMEDQLYELPDQILGIMRTNDQSELAEWYSVADVFANPTLEDNYPTTALEAQACGTPVVTFDSDGAAETVYPGKGIVVKRLDYDGLLTAVKKAEKMKQHFVRPNVKDKAMLGAEYEVIYRQLIRNGEQVNEDSVQLG